ncbi:MAG: sensor histidine kinase, partial [Pseudobdellovibrio sp.]
MVTFLKSLSIRIRLTALFVIIFGVSTIFFAGAIYYSLNDSLLQDFDNALYNYSIDVSRNIEFGINDDVLFQVDKDKIFPFSSGNALILIRHSSGTVLSQEGNFGDLKFPYREEIRQVNEGADSSYTTLEDIKDLPEAEADSYRLITFPLTDIGPSSFYLQIAVPMTTFEVQLDRLTRIITYGFPALLLIAILLGLYLS